MISSRVCRAFIVCVAFATSPIGEAEPLVEIFDIVIDGVNIEVTVSEAVPVKDFSPLEGPSVRYDTLDGYRLSVDTGEVRFSSPHFLYDFYLESSTDTFLIPVQLRSSIGFDHAWKSVDFSLHAGGVEQLGQIQLPIYSHMPPKYIEWEIDGADPAERIIEADLETKTNHVITLRNLLNDFPVLVERNGEIRGKSGLRPELIIGGSSDGKALDLPAGNGATATLDLVLEPTLGAALSQAFLGRRHEVNVPLRYQANGVGTTTPLSIPVGVRVVPSFLLLLGVWLVGVSLGTWMSFERYRRKDRRQTRRDLRICVAVAIAMTVLVIFNDWCGNALVLLGNKADPYHPLAVLAGSLFVSFNGRGLWKWLKSLRPFGGRRHE
jgi:hypothetical protein